MKENEKYELIDRYLNGDLQGKELLDIENQMSTDSSFAEEVRLQKITNQIIIENRLLEISDKIKRDLEDKPGNKVPLLKLSLIGTLLIIISSIIGVFIYKPFTKDSNSNIDINKNIPLTESSIEVNVDSVAEINPNQDDNYNSPSNINITTAENVQKNSNQSVNSSSDKKTSQNNEIPPMLGKERSIQLLSEKFTKSDKSTHSKSPNICEGVSITASVTSTETCVGQQKGSISISQASIKGGHAPYLFSLNNGHASNSNTFNNLPAGKYKVIISDHSNCTDTIYTFVAEQKCVKFKEYSFNPDKGPWKLPMDKEATAVVNIYDKNGTLLYSINASNSGTISWDGKRTNGESLPDGAYYFTIEYQDEKFEHGHVTIVR